MRPWHRELLHRERLWPRSFVANPPIILFNHQPQRITMAIKVGDRLPEAKFRVMTAEGPGWKTTDEVFKGKKVVLFAVPGAFTPTCHKNHMPGFVTNADKIRAKGIDNICVTSVNDVFVMNEWKKA